MSSEDFFKEAFKKIEKDSKLKASHVSLYVSLINCWAESEFKNPIKISQKQIALLGKVKSKAIYYKCMKELHQFGYIKYAPSYNPDGSSIYINGLNDNVQSI